MSRIKLLPQSIAEKIAAGEVIQRPASVVKELLENSIDAQANEIQISYKEGGKQSITIIDNGRGIASDDLRLAIKSHATSKIVALDDLFKLSSLGFRGEALASIANVAKLKLISRQIDDLAGTMIEVHGGEEVDFRSIGAPLGTRVEVHDLFYNIPARKKHVKSHTREAAYINEEVIPLALAYPHIRFQVINEERTVFTTGARAETLKTWGDIFGHEQGEKFIHLPKTKGQIVEIEMYLGMPTLAQATSKGIFMFVNNRPFYNRQIISAIIDVYKEYIPHRQFPQALLYLTINPIHVDVNVHPSKREVSFSDLDLIREQIYKFAGTALKESLVANVRKVFSQEENKPSSSNQAQSQQLFIKETLSTTQFPAKSATLNQPLQDTSSKPPKTEFVLPALGSINKLCQFYNSFIFVEGTENLLLVDQHAAHERILYNKALASFQSTESKTQALLTPVVIDLTPSQSEIKKEIIDYLASLSFILEDFGANSLILREGASYIHDKDKVLSSCRDLIEQFAAGYRKKTKEDLNFISLTTIACHASVKAGDKMSEPEMRALLEQLFSTDNNRTCPHGRPIIKIISLNELNGFFAR